MNKIKLSMLAVVAASSVASAAVADGFYVSIGGGAAVPSKKEQVSGTNTFKKATIGLVQGEVGYSFGDFRAGIELHYIPRILTAESGAEKKPSKFNSWGSLVNFYYDVKGLSDTFEPYVTAGFGGSSVKSTEDSALRVVGQDNINRKSLFTWKAGLGTRVNISENIALDAGYSYLGFARMQDLSSGKKIKLDAHTFSGAVVYKF